MKCRNQMANRLFDNYIETTYHGNQVWKIIDDERWENGYIYCPHQFVGEHSEIDKLPNNKCPYKLEHLIVSEDDLKDIKIKGSRDVELELVKKELEGL